MLGRWAGRPHAVFSEECMLPAMCCPGSLVGPLALPGLEQNSRSLSLPRLKGCMSAELGGVQE